MKKFHVQTEARGFAFEVVVEADSMDEAVKIVRERHCQPRTVEITPQPTWVEPAPEAAEEGYEICEYSYEIFADCEDCGVVLFEGCDPGNDWPWQHTSGDEGHHTYICYPCAMKRKEAGNYCAYYKHFYRDDHHYGCDSCPAGDCTKARDRYFKNVHMHLTEAARYLCLHVDPSINSYLANNEFGLARDLLEDGMQKAKARNSDAYCPDLEAAKLLMSEGWK